MRCKEYASSSISTTHKQVSDFEGTTPPVVEVYVNDKLIAINDKNDFQIPKNVGTRVSIPLSTACVTVEGIPRFQHITIKISGNEYEMFTPKTQMNLQVSCPLKNDRGYLVPVTCTSNFGWIDKR